MKAVDNLRTRFGGILGGAPSTPAVPPAKPAPPAAAKTVGDVKAKTEKAPKKVQDTLGGSLRIKRTGSGLSASTGGVGLTI